MTPPEFDQWWSDFLERFPDMGEWFCEGRSDAAQTAILCNWSDALTDVTLAEALAVTKGMYLGDLAGFTGRWDRDRIPAIIRQHALAARPASLDWTGPTDDGFEPIPEETRRAAMNGVLARYIQLRKDGATVDELRDFLRRSFPDNRRQERRYNCLHCLDSGRLQVWHYERVRTADEDGIEAALACIYTTSTVACCCKAGKTYTSRQRPLVQLNLLTHCVAINGDVSSEQAIEAFATWQRERRSVEKRSNYEPGFAAYAGSEPTQREAF